MFKSLAKDIPFTKDNLWSTHGLNEMSMLEFVKTAPTKMIRISGIAFIVTAIDDRTCLRVAEYAWTIDAESNMEAEFVAMIEALKMVPDSVQGTCHTDLNHLPAVINYTQKTRERLRKYVSMLRQELDRTGLELTYTKAGLRTVEYRDCHVRARAAQRNTPRNRQLQESDRIRRILVNRH